MSSQKHHFLIREEKCQAALSALMKAKATFLPLGNKGNSFGWKLKLLLRCHLEDQYGKGKGFECYWGEKIKSGFVRVLFREVFVPSCLSAIS